MRGALNLAVSGIHSGTAAGANLSASWNVCRRNSNIRNISFTLLPKENSLKPSVVSSACLDVCYLLLLLTDQCHWEKNGKKKDREKLKAFVPLFVLCTVNLMAEHTVNNGVPENWHTVLLWQLLDGLMDDSMLCFINTACQKCTCTYFLCNKGKNLAVVSRDILQWYICPKYKLVKNASSDTVIFGSKSILTLLYELAQAEDLKLLIHKINGRWSL